MAVLTLRKAVLATFTLLATKKHLLGEAESFQMTSWLLRCVSHNELFTDDTYVFARAMKAFTQAGT